MRLTILSIVTVLLLAGMARADEEFITLRDRSTIRGDVVKIDEDSAQIRLAEGAEMDILFESMEANSAYRIRAKYISSKDGPAHFELGTWAMDKQLWYYARRELRLAADLDTDLAGDVNKKLEELAELEGKYFFEKGMETAQAEKFDEALAAFRTLRERYPDSKYAVQAQEELKKITAAINRKNDEREQKLDQLKKRQEDQKNARVAEGHEAVFNGVDDDLKRAKDLNRKGLRLEGDGNNKDAVKSWEEADLLLAHGLSTLDELSAKTNDVDLIDRIKEVRDAIKEYQILVGLNVAQYYTRLFNITRAIKWTNKVLELDPTNPSATQLKLTIIQEQLRRRW